MAFGFWRLLTSRQKPRANPQQPILRDRCMTHGGSATFDLHQPRVPASAPGSSTDRGRLVSGVIPAVLPFTPSLDGQHQQPAASADGRSQILDSGHCINYGRFRKGKIMNPAIGLMLGLFCGQDCLNRESNGLCCGQYVLLCSQCATGTTCCPLILDNDQLMAVVVADSGWPSGTAFPGGIGRCKYVNQTCMSDGEVDWCAAVGDPIIKKCSSFLTPTDPENCSSQ